MKMEQVFHYGGTTKDRSDGRPKLAGERSAREQPANVRRKFVVDRVADGTKDQYRNLAFAANLHHGQRFHIDGQRLMPGAKLPLFFAEPHDAVQDQ